MTGELSVLIVEDDADLRASIAALVEREGFRTIECDTLAQARERIAESSPDVVLLDLALPDGNGLELLADQDSAESPEIVVMTGDAAGYDRPAWSSSRAPLPVEP